MAVRSLESAGYDVLKADSGVTALELLSGVDALDILVADVVLPGGMSGMDVAAEVRSRWPRVKVLFISGYPETILEDETLDGVSSSFLAKPFKRAQLAEEVGDLLAGSTG